MHNYQHKVFAVLNDRSTSYWLRDAILALTERDPVDAAHDAHYLASLMDARVKELQR
jgi:hypothetical protein